MGARVDRAVVLAVVAVVALLAIAAGAQIARAVVTMFADASSALAGGAQPESAKSAVRAQGAAAPEIAHSPAPLPDGTTMAVAHSAASPSESGADVAEGVRPEAPAPEPSEVAAPARPAHCTGSLRLVATVVNTRRPERSLAAVHAYGGTRLVRPGGRIGAQTLLAVGRESAYLRRADASVCELPVFVSETGRAESPVATQAPATANRPAAPGEALDAAELSQGIRQLDARTFAVSRASLTKALANPLALKKQARLRLRKEGDRAVGMEVARVPKQSLLKNLGMQKGDVLQNINGVELTSADGALRALTALRTQGRFDIHLQRQGAATVLTYIVN